MRKFFAVFVAISLLVAQLQPSFTQTAPAAPPPEIEKITNLADLTNRLYSILETRSKDITNLTSSDEKTLLQLLTRLQALAESKTLSDSEKSELQAILEKFQSPLISMEKTYADNLKGFASGESISPEIAKQLEAKCGPLYRDVIASFSKKEGALSDSKSLPARLQDCYAVYDLLAAQLDAQAKQLSDTLALLENERAQLAREFATASPEQRPAIQKKLDEKDAQIKETREKQKKTREVKGKVDWGKMLLGAAVFAVGVVFAAYGDVNTAMVFWSVGGKTMESAGNPKPGQKEYVVDGPPVRTREGVQEKLDPGAEAAAAVAKDFAQSGMKNISFGERQGNFIVFLQPETHTWTVMQVKERLLIAQISPASIKEIRDSAKKIAALNELKNPSVVELHDPSAALKLRFTAERLDGAKVKGGLTETASASREFILTID